ncbi:MAG: PAS domain S-box protein, partial [Rhodospirillales bacterium]|nr:PAS domain S-box protein [Rhodospirillales bacterium]
MPARIGNSFPEAIRYIVIDYSDMDAIAAAADKGLVYDYFQRPWDARKMKLVIDNALEIVLMERDRAARLKDVQNVEASLNEWDTRFHALLEAAPDAIIVVDEDGKIVLCNAQSERLFGYPRDEILGHPIEKLIPGHFRNHEAHRRGFITDPRPREMGSGSDLYLRGKDGIEIPVEIALSPLNTSDGLLVIAAIRDVTERKQA